MVQWGLLQENPGTLHRRQLQTAPAIPRKYWFLDCPRFLAPVPDLTICSITNITEMHVSWLEHLSWEIHNVIKMIIPLTLKALKINNLNFQHLQIISFPITVIRSANNRPYELKTTGGVLLILLWQRRQINLIIYDNISGLHTTLFLMEQPSGWK